MFWNMQDACGPRLKNPNSALAIHESFCRMSQSFYENLFANQSNGSLAIIEFKLSGLKWRFGVLPELDDFGHQ